jgi:hypothetical protein
MSEDSLSSVPDVVCAVCSEPLNRFRRFGSDEENWRHPLDAEKDHEPHPIPRAEAITVVMYCDFCSTAGVSWSYATAGELTNTLAVRNVLDETEHHRFARDWETVRHKEAPATDLARNVFSDHWAACVPCAELIELRDVERLITRVRRVNPTAASIPRRLMRDHFGQFFAAIGPRSWIGPEKERT